MTGVVFFTSLLAAIALLFAISLFRDGEDGGGLTALVLSAGLAWATTVLWSTPEERAQKDAAEAAQRAAEITPRKVSSADGCTVYTFKPQDRWLYFTKCEGAEATTQNIYSTTSGKTTTTHTMEIKTK